MNTNKKVLICFVFTILFLYSTTIIYSFYYNYQLKNTNAIVLEKKLFKDLSGSKNNIESREISQIEYKKRKYNIKFDENIFEDNLVKANEKLPNWYIMIEKPDCQFFEVYLNNELLGSRGDAEGKSNLDKGTYFIKFNQTSLKDENEIEIEMYSDYMTGISGEILILSDYDYKKIVPIISFSRNLMRITSVIIFYSVILLILFILAWKKRLYNIKTYIYFLVSILALGIGLLNYRVLEYIFIDFFTFKKISAIFLQVSIIFSTLAISILLNAKYKFNIGMISLLITFYFSIVSSNMIEFIKIFNIINLGIIGTIIQLIITVIIYRKRSAISSGLMILGFSLCGLSILKIIFIINNIIYGGMLIDVPIIAIIYSIMVLFLFYLELSQAAYDYESVSIDDYYNMGITNYMQGSFIIDKSLSVVGAYSTSCDFIFDRLILGSKFLDILPLENYKDRELMKENLELIFNKNYSFKDGFLALLPLTAVINNRIYQINYNLFKRSEYFLRVILSDVTKNTELQKKLDKQKNEYKFIINSLKFKQEIGYFIKITKEFIESLKIQGFTEDNKKELHTIKGNLGQLGFYKFEKSVHEVEDLILNENCNKNNLINILEEGLEDSLLLLDNHIGRSYFKDGYNEFIIPKDALLKLEKLYIESINENNLNEKFYNKLKELKYVDLKSMFNRYFDYIERISKTVNKSIFPLILEGDNIRVNPEKAEEILMVLVAIFRNSVIHGIEIPEERVQNNKDSYGKISCNISKNKDIVSISIEDDGKGIDYKKIVRKAVEKGIIDLEESYKLTEEEKINLIFVDKMSAYEQVDLYAGRGFGLSSVKKVIESFNGTIDIFTKINIGTKFIINIPLDCLID